MVTKFAFSLSFLLNPRQTYSPSHLNLLFPRLCFRPITQDEPKPGTTANNGKSK
ncbi:hypothetical protein AYX14_01770 [Cryptococcus neoformans]|nr:hypothetical protein AYX15_01455 [Cryptococcus neoformans var. grubii]OWZ72732.1 hypothetical protein AYX14_01770 [Cryptococcus neoformans var. grubii]